MSTSTFDHNRAFNEVNRLRTIASEMARLQNEAQRALSDIHTLWEGAAANEFITANERWRRDTKALETEISSIASLISNTINTI